MDSQHVLIRPASHLGSLGFRLDEYQRKQLQQLNIGYWPTCLQKGAVASALRFSLTVTDPFCFEDLTSFRDRPSPGPCIGRALCQPLPRQDRSGPLKFVPSCI